ncbi:MAG: dTDP-4-dehydrorhamnose 3,5-epimerase family protein [candidate division Zixibacteria bacterium]|nr:dTDP-4-dehydrorhamnose 3,5-epimerase family protein [candidate division Zixibacteria bacterium]
MNQPNIEGVVIRPLILNTDGRGWLIELFRTDELQPPISPLMSYVSMTKPGLLRGPHEHREQTDYFCFIGPSTFLVRLWDNRKDSRTFGAKIEIELGEHNKASVIVPPGVVHGYKNIGTVDGLMYNAPNRLYGGEGKDGPIDEIRYENIDGHKFSME